MTEAHPTLRQRREPWRPAPVPVEVVTPSALLVLRIGKQSRVAKKRGVVSGVVAGEGVLRGRLGVSGGIRSAGRN
jgi:hypothetical protein